MKHLWTAALFLGFAMTAQAETFLYVSMVNEQKIQVFRLDSQSGALSPVETFGVDGTPGALNVDPAKKYLFASLRNNGTLASYAIDASGKLKHLSTAPLGKDENAAFVGTDHSGKWLLSASYMAGKVVVHRLNENGEIQTPAVQTVTTTKTAHCIAVHPENRFVYVPHVAPNAVYKFLFDPATGKLADAGTSPGGKPGAGPRHLAFDPKQPMAYTSDESGSSITAYRFDRKTGMTPVETLSTLPADFKGKNTTAEVKVHPSGKFVWVSNRGHDSLAGFRIGDGGKLTALGQTPTEKTPRSFEIDPDGRFVFGAGEGSGKLAVYSVNQETGALTRIHTYEVGKSLTWVMAVTR